MQDTKRLYSSLYDKLYWKYKDEWNLKLALFVRKFFIEGITETEKLMDELWFASDRSVRRRKAIVNKDLLKLASTSKDVFIPPKYKT